jgi:GAF domain-containing protein
LVLVGGVPFGNLYLTDKIRGKEFTEEDEQTIMLLAEFAGVAIDHARRYSRLDTQHTDLKRTVDALDATMQIVRALGGETDLDLILGLGPNAAEGSCPRALVIEHEHAGEMGSRLGVRADGGLVVPLLFRGRGYGVLLAVDRLEDGPAFSTEDQRLLEAFAASAATAVATAGRGRAPPAAHSRGRARTRTLGP